MVFSPPSTMVVGLFCFTCLKRNVMFWLKCDTASSDSGGNGFPNSELPVLKVDSWIRGIHYCITTRAKKLKSPPYFNRSPGNHRLRRCEM